MVSENTSDKLTKAALMNGVMNAVINGIINYFQVKGKSDLFLTVDSISTGGHTVLGGAVILATSLAVILTAIGYFTFKVPNKPAFFPLVFWLIIKNAFFTFGVVVTLSILLQKFAGSISVTPVAAAIIVGIIAGLVAGIVDYMTKKELLKH
ncbi:MAG: hypothetical protein JXB00_05615 [Bacteroidales bacterium]|nr:hypothetical protein [Bacteroidales bacterium]